MAELIPSVLLYGQALKLLEDLDQAQQQGMLTDATSIAEKISEILEKYERSAGRPLVEYEPVSEWEPPQSEKSNRFFRSAERDVNLMQQQVDMLRAAVITAHNLTKTEILESWSENARVKNKLKTLQLYSNGSDSSIITFGDSFQSMEFTEQSRVPTEEQPSLSSPGFVTLGKSPQVVDLSANADVFVLSTSNGFPGNNEEILPPQESERYRFRAEDSQSNDLAAIRDAEPDTWFEYERYELPGTIRNRKGSNFTYADQQIQEDGTSVTRLVNWAEGPESGVLKLNLEFDLKSIQMINYIDITPYGLEGNSNQPIFVRSIQTSSNATDWYDVEPDSVYLGTDVNVSTARVAPNIAVSRAVWPIPTRAARYVRIQLEQSRPIRANIGHLYWNDRKTGEQRVPGPVPRIENPSEYKDKETQGDLVQGREYFVGKRWAIGIRDISIKQINYNPRSVIVTRQLQAGGVIDRVVLESADVEVPHDYPSDQRWVRFFISPDDGVNWYPIAKITDEDIGIPEQISFNDPLPDSLREPGVYNVNTDTAVTAIRMKVEMLRPNDRVQTTPVLKSYALKIKRQST